MRVLIAPDKFKGSISAAEAAEAIAEGLGSGFESRNLPIADGGEGTSEAICQALGGRWILCQAADPLGRPVEAGYALVETDGVPTAVLEMSQASGLWRVSEAERNPQHSSTFGTGQMIQDAIRNGARKIILGIGGSATNDGGSGMAQALGYRFLDSQGNPVRELPSQLTKVARIEAPRLPNWPEFITACDVTNPLLGENGATRVYGPQKGVQPADFYEFEARLEHLADLVKLDLGVDAREIPGAGAAGGLGFGTLAFCQARLQQGFALVSELLDLEEAILGADLVITGEGSLDAQTLNGKGPDGVARLARQHNKPIIAFAGRTDGSSALDEAFDRVYTIRPEGVSVEESMRCARSFLTESAKNAVSFIEGLTNT